MKTGMIESVELGPRAVTMSEAVLVTVGGKAVTMSCVVVEVVGTTLGEDVIRMTDVVVVLDPKLGIGTVCNPRESDDPTLGIGGDNGVVAIVGIPVGIVTEFEEIVA